MISKGAFRHVESELYAYPDTKKEIERLRDSIMYDKAVDDNSGGGRASLPSDNTALVATALVSHKRLNTLESVSDAIESVYGRLNEDHKKLIWLRYWKKPQLLTWDGIALELKVSRITALRWRNKIVCEIATKIGWR